MAHAYDLVVRGGEIVDGAGGAPYEADVAVLEGRIAAIGKIAGAGAEEIDASGKIVTPGFVDVHTHYDGQITWENRLAPSSAHGVTTVVMGNCGVGFAPVKADQHELVVKLMEGVEDIPDVVMTAGLPWNWETFPQYLDALEQRHGDVDFAAQLPHSPLRVYVMGQRGVDLEPPTEDDLARMRALTAEAIRAGALGVTTSRSWTHRFRDGRPAPSINTERREVLALAAGLRDAGSGVFQMLPNTHLPVEEQFALLREIAEISGRPVSFTFGQMQKDPDGWRTMMMRLAEARAQGHAIRAQVLPRSIGAVMGLELSMHPFAFHPSFRPLEALPLAEKVRAMRDPALRAKLLSEEPVDPHPFFKLVVSEQEMLFVLGDPPNYHPAREESIGARARAAGVAPAEFLYDALLERDGKEMFYRPMANLGGERFQKAGRDLLGQENVILGLGDGGAHYSMICDAAYSTYFLTYWCRDAEADRKVSLPRAIQMLARDTALAVGLEDRGLVKQGMKADLNVIDLDRLRLYGPRPSYDLPAGGRRLNQRADGYEAAIVSGVVTYREGAPTGALPGRLVRGARPASAPRAA
ncbi:MAG: amidohydrolase family protein [Hyphomonadaceae bacterium]